MNDKKYCNLGQMMGFYFRDQFQFIYVEDHNELVRAVGANYTLGVVNKKLLQIWNFIFELSKATNTHS